MNKKHDILTQAEIDLTEQIEIYINSLPLALTTSQVQFLVSQRFGLEAVDSAAVARFRRNSPAKKIKKLKGNNTKNIKIIDSIIDKIKEVLDSASKDDPNRVIQLSEFIKSLIELQTRLIEKEILDLNRCY
jgi:hypothetical protein